MKEKLFKTAIKLFQEQGYEKVSITMICEACGVTKGCFYYHYPAKDDLLLSYYTTIDTEKLTDIMTEMLLIPNNAEKLWKIFNYYLECSVILGPELLKYLIKRDMDRNLSFFPQTMETMKQRFPRFYKIIEALSMEGQKKGEICTARSWIEIWEDFASAFLGILAYWCSNDGQFDVTGRVYRVFELMYEPSSTVGPSNPEP